MPEMICTEPGCPWAGTVQEAEEHEEETGHQALMTEFGAGEFDYSGDGLPD
jgi:hypothetical protein